MKATAALILLLVGLMTLTVGIVNSDTTLLLCATGMCFSSSALFLSARKGK